MKKRKILFITERRADYSRLKPIMRAVKKSKKLEMFLIVTGTHLLNSFGETVKIIKKDGFKINATLPIFTRNNKSDGSDMAKAMGRAIIGLSDILKKNRPDIIFTGFDLGAHLAVAICGMHLNIHVFHIDGGQVSGTIDEVIRHALTKFSHVHLATTKESAQRIIKLGEDPKYVFYIGSPNLDTIRNIKYFPKKDICKKYNLNPTKKLAIFLQHPVTTEIEEVSDQINQSIAALKSAAKKYDLEVIAFYPNSDAGGKKIISAIKKSGFKNLPHAEYEDFLRLLKVADFLMGNSSAGIQEAPSFGLPVVNIGTRQKNRERGINVIDVPNKKSEIIKAIKKSLFDKKFIEKVKRGKNPYDKGDTAERIVKILETIKLPPIQKTITY